MYDFIVASIEKISLPSWIEPLEHKDPKQQKKSYKTQEIQNKRNSSVVIRL